VAKKKEGFLEAPPCRNTIVVELLSYRKPSSHGFCSCVMTVNTTISCNISKGLHPPTHDAMPPLPPDTGWLPLLPREVARGVVSVNSIGNHCNWSYQSAPLFSRKPPHTGDKVSNNYRKEKG